MPDVEVPNNNPESLFASPNSPAPAAKDVLQEARQSAKRTPATISSNLTVDEIAMMKKDASKHDIKLDELLSIPELLHCYVQNSTTRSSTDLMASSFFDSSFQTTSINSNFDFKGIRRECHVNVFSKEDLSRDFDQAGNDWSSCNREKNDIRRLAHSILQKRYNGKPEELFEANDDDDQSVVTSKEHCAGVVQIDRTILQFCPSEANINVELCKGESTATDSRSVKAKRQEATNLYFSNEQYRKFERKVQIGSKVCQLTIYLCSTDCAIDADPHDRRQEHIRQRDGHHKFCKNCPQCKCKMGAKSAHFTASKAVSVLFCREGVQLVYLLARLLAKAIKSAINRGDKEAEEQNRQRFNREHFTRMVYTILAQAVRDAAEVARGRSDASSITVFDFQKQADATTQAKDGMSLTHVAVLRDAFKTELPSSPKSFVCFPRFKSSPTALIESKTTPITHSSRCCLDEKGEKTKIAFALNEFAGASTKQGLKARYIEHHRLTIKSVAVPPSQSKVEYINPPGLLSMAVYVLPGTNTIQLAGCMQPLPNDLWGAVIAN